MSQDFEHAFAVSMHIPKFVFNLESVSMYKSGLLRITVTTIIELHAQNLNKLMLLNQCYDLKKTISA